MNVAGRTVRIAESHEQVLVDWAEAHRDCGRPLALVTLDRHTDTAPALGAEFAITAGDDGTADDLPRWQRRVLGRYRGARGAELDGLVERLENDEHIDAALQLRLLDRALIVSSQMGTSGPAGIAGATVHRPPCAPDCPRPAHDDPSCERRRFDAILESSLLGPALLDLGFDPAAGVPYVLDIDLDTFSTRRGLAPADPAVFHDLIAGALLVTIAREPEYVAESLDDHDADEIEAAVLRHVARAMERHGAA